MVSTSDTKKQIEDLFKSNGEGEGFMFHLHVELDEELPYYQFGTGKEKEFHGLIKDALMKKLKGMQFDIPTKLESVEDLGHGLDEMSTSVTITDIDVNR